MPDDIVDNAIDLHTANTVLNQHSDVRDPLVVGFLFIGQAAAAWLLLRLQDRHTWQSEALKPTILPQHTAFRQLELGFVSDPLIMRFPGIGRAQKPDPSACIHQQHILDRMVFLLATLVDFLLIAILGSGYWSFGTILAKKGGLLGRVLSVQPATGQRTLLLYGPAASVGWPTRCSGYRATTAPTY